MKTPHIPGLVLFRENLFVEVCGFLIQSPIFCESGIHELDYCRIKNCGS